MRGHRHATIWVSRSSGWIDALLLLIFWPVDSWIHTATKDPQKRGQNVWYCSGTFTEVASLQPPNGLGVIAPIGRGIQ
jgi:hypothetical protein